jgi:hypothetical protein
MAMKTVWFWKGPPLNSKWSVVATYATDEHPHPFTVESKVCPTKSEPHSFVMADEHERLVVRLTDEQFDGVPDLWYILEENPHPTDMVSIHGMAGGEFPKGTVLTVKDVGGIKLTASDRVGFVRWFRSDSRLQQVMVNEMWRRKRISTVLISVADVVIMSGGYGPHLNGGDITTADGEELRKAWSESTRVAPRIGSVEKAVDNE